MDISKFVDSEKSEMLKMLGNLIAKDTTNPPGNEYLAADVIKKFFRKEKIKYKIFEKKKGRTNVIGYIGKGKPRLIIACHFDVVPAGEGWKTNPFKMVLKGGKAYGRGTNDNKGPMASMLIAGKIIKKFEKNLNGQVILACVADEEKGSKNGMYYLMEEGKLDGNYAIVPDIEREMKKITVAEKGLLHVKITSFGKQAHGSRPEEGVNAVWNMIEFLNALKKHTDECRPEKHSILSPPTVNLGMLNGGSAPNIVPGECEAVLDFRYLPMQSKKIILDSLKKIIAEIRKKNMKARFTIEVLDSQAPVEVDRESVIVKSIEKHAKAVLGRKPDVIGLSGTTVVKPLVQAGVEAVGFSPGESVAHMSNEYISVKQLMDFAKIVVHVSFDLLG